MGFTASVGEYKQLGKSYKALVQSEADMEVCNSGHHYWKDPWSVCGARSYHGQEGVTPAVPKVDPCADTHVCQRAPVNFVSTFTVR